jgi:VIT1/CCC1 family predicted Fe2+/Mn2+ transporter
MRIFFYKFIIIILGLFILYQLTIGYTIKKIQQKFYSINVKEQSEFIKDKLREEIKNTLKKDEILTKEDAILIKKFYLKILSEINRVE